MQQTKTKQQTKQQTKRITESQWLQALGLFTLGAMHRMKADEFHEALHRLLGIEKWSWLSDTVYGAYGVGPGVKEFNEAMAEEGFVIVPDKPAKRKRKVS